MSAQFLSVSEAAFVAEVSARDVNRVIDEGILPGTLISLQDGRRVLRSASSLIRFYFHTDADLSAKMRLRIIARLSERIARPNPPLSDQALDAGWRVSDGAITVDMARFVSQSESRAEALDAACARVVEDPEILRGTPVIRGTRVPVYDLAAALLAGQDRRRLLDAYPSLDEAALDAAQIYAAAHPPRGRPRPVGDGGPVGQILVDRHVARRRRG